MTPDALRQRLTTLLPGARPFPDDAARGQVVIVLERDALPDALRTLRDDPEVRCEQLSDLTVVDYLGRTPRFEVVYQLYSIAGNHRVRVMVPVPDDDAVVLTASSVGHAAGWAE